MPGSKKQVRTAFRKAVFERDGYPCVLCGRPGKDRQGGDGHEKYHRLAEADLVPLDAHHITARHEMPGGGYVKENGITMCDSCHRQAESFHQTGSAPPGCSPEDLYARIGSSFEEAHRTSLELSD